MPTRLTTRLAVLAALSLGIVATALAHPGSGIVVNARGEVFFQDSIGRAIWKIDRRGRVVKECDRLGGHWMALDPRGAFSRADLTLFERITRPGVRPALIVADGGAPIAVCADGNLYYGTNPAANGELAPGALALARLAPDGRPTLFAPGLRQELARLDQGITGLAAGPDGHLYVAAPSAVFKVRMDGTFTTLAAPIRVPECDAGSPTNPHSSQLRGLAVDRRGVVYAAATGCHCVVKIRPDGTVATLLKSERPWSPTGVALFRDEVYVLEYTHANAGLDRGWQPRVRRVDRQGRVTTLATIPLASREPEPRSCGITGPLILHSGKRPGHFAGLDRRHAQLRSQRGA